MKLIMFSIHDSKADAFLTPWSAPTVAVGIRQWKFAANDETTEFFKYPSDYTLFELGEFNQQTGMTTFHDTPKSHGLAITHRENA